VVQGPVGKRADYEHFIGFADFESVPVQQKMFKSKAKKYKQQQYGNDEDFDEFE